MIPYSCLGLPFEILEEGPDFICFLYLRVSYGSNNLLFEFEDIFPIISLESIWKDYRGLIFVFTKTTKPPSGIFF